jgi:EmrB/QacA subfamily drug resistance transporter
MSAAADQDSKFDARLKKVALVVVLGTVMANLDTTIVNVSVDELGRDFHTTISTIQWVASGYMLALGVAIPLTTWAMKRFGGRQVWVASLVVFLVGSILCGCAWSVTSLITFRVLQGLGGGIILPLGQALLAREAGPHRIGRVMGVVGIPFMLAPVVGPVAGGLIIGNLSWRWIFFVNIPLGTLALFLGRRMLPFEPRTDAQRSPLDVVGLGLLSPGLALLVYGFTTASNSGGFASAPVEISLGLSIPLILGFVAHALHIENPLVNLRLFKVKSYALGAGVSFLVTGALFGSMFLAPLYFQEVRGRSPLAAGLFMAPQGIGAMCTMNFSGKIVDRVGGSRIAPIGFLIMSIATLPFIFLTSSTSTTLLVVALVIRGFGMGLGPMPAAAASYQRLKRETMPSATTLFSIVQRVGATFFTAAMAIVLQQQSKWHAGASGTRAAHLATAFSRTYLIAMVATVLCGIGALFFPKHAPPVAGNSEVVDSDSPLLVGVATGD